MDFRPFIVPPSPVHEDILTIFTTLNDDASLPDIRDEVCPSPDEFWTGLCNSHTKGPPTQLDGSLRHGKHRSQPHRIGARVEGNKSAQCRSIATHDLPGFICFSSTSGELVTRSKRSAFTQDRRKEVREVRQRGACLRCQIRKITCSGEDPCKACISLANAKAGSRALMWMDCVRPNFSDLNPFDRKDFSAAKWTLIDHVIHGLELHEVYLEFQAPFTIDVEETAQNLAWWLSQDSIDATWSVAGLLSSSAFSSLLRCTMNAQIGRDASLLVHLTSHLYTDGSGARFGNHSYQDVELVRDYVGKRMIFTIDSLLKPPKLRAMQKSSQQLKATFLLVFSVAISLGYAIGADNVLNGSKATSSQGPHDTLLRLLYHYITYIGQSSGLLSKDIQLHTLADEARSLWSKKAHFAWLPPPYATFRSDSIPDHPFEQHHFSTPTTVPGITYCGNCGVHLRMRSFDESCQESNPEECQVSHADLDFVCNPDVLDEARSNGHEDPFWHYVEGDRLLI